MLSLTLHSPRWSGSCRKPKMVDLQINWEALWPDTSLFGDEPIDAISIDDFLGNGKSNSKETEAVLSLPSLGWFDEKVDLSVFDNPNSLLDHHNETKLLMEDESALLGLLSSNYESQSLSLDIFQDEEIDFSNEFNDQNFVAEPTSSETLDVHLPSPQGNTLQVCYNSALSSPVQSPTSPYSDISEAPVEPISSHILQSPDSSSVTSDLDFTSSSLDSSRLKVTVCDDEVASLSNSEPELSLEELSRYVRKRKFINNGETRPKVVKVMFPEDVPAPRLRKSRDSRERKKVQNKEAAARYRVKKRMEEKVLSGEVESLESEQKILQDKHDKMEAEIKYLKSLMCEILTKKGIIK